MDKKPYYVSVQAGTVLERQGDAAYEFEINATEEEVDRLIELFEMREDFEDSTAIRAAIPGMPYHQDLENDNYDAALRQIYEKLYELGTNETKETIERMGVIRQ